MVSDKLKFSICIPAYEMKGKGSEYLEVLFQSIKKQTYANFEVTVSDHSKDEAIKKLCDHWEKEFNLAYFPYTEHRGNASYNANNAIRHASGDIIQVIHQDDFFYSDKCLEETAKTLNANLNLSWGAISYIHTDATGEKFFRPRTPYYNRNIIKAKNTIGPPSVIFYRKNEELVLQDEHLIWMNDCELCYRLHQKYGEPIIVLGTLMAVRQWPDSVTSSIVTPELRKKEIEYSIKKHNLETTPKLTSRIIDRLKRDWRKAKDFILSLMLKENLLTKLANRYGSDKGTRKMRAKDGDRHFYTEYYHKYFDKIRKSKLNILEIGVGSGPSLKIWPKYFPNTKIFAIDIDDFSRLNTDQITCLKADQSNREDLLSAMSKIKEPLDTIIDDGGHYMNQQQISFGFLFKYLKSGGMYFIEDLHTSHWPHNGFDAVYNNVPIDINSDRSNTTLKMARDFIETKKIVSQYLTDEEIEYLNGNIKECILYNTAINKYGQNHLAVFIKK